MNISPAEWARLSELLDQALDMTGEERAAWIARFSPDDQPLSEPLRKLLKQEARVETRDALEIPPDFAGALLAESARKLVVDGELKPDAVIGPYRLVRELGVGGMAAVWLAERIDRKLKRQVALKFPYTGPFQRQLAERLVRERDILAGLEHPNIARLYDADVTASGSPFLVLEFVEGLAIHEYCERRQLTIRERLALFLQVLKAVQYAHARLVIHRDIKPTNILISQDGVAHLLDFGVAKLMPEGLAKETALTNFTGRALTPDYASPEQITGAAITTASDVYSLGVVLYELLVGARPYRLKRDSRTSLEDAITEADAVVPSRAVKSAKESKKKAAQLRGDLDAILLKALRKDSAARYSTVDAFRDDIERHLDGRTISVQSGSTGYRLRKFLRRNRIAAAAVAAVVASLAVGLGMALWQARVASRQTAKVSAINGFMLQIISGADVQGGVAKQPDQMTVAELLDTSSTQVLDSLDDQPDVKLEIIKEVASIYETLGVEDKALGLIHKGIDISGRSFGSDSPVEISFLVRFANALSFFGRMDELGPAITEAEAACRSAGDDHSVDYATLLKVKGTLLKVQGKREESKASFERSARIYATYYPDHPYYAATLMYLAQAHLQLSEMDAAERVADRAVQAAVHPPIDKPTGVYSERAAIRQQLAKYSLANNKLATANVYSVRAAIRQQLGKYALAENDYTKAATLYAQTVGLHNVLFLKNENIRGEALQQAGRRAEGLALLQSTADELIANQAQGSTPATILRRLEAAYLRDGSYERVLETCEKSIELTKPLHQPNLMASELLDKAQALAMLDRLDEAEKAEQEAESVLPLPIGTPRTAVARRQLLLGEIAFKRSQFERAAACARRARETTPDDVGDSDLRASAYVLESRIAVARGDWKAATERIDSARSLLPNTRLMNDPFVQAKVLRQYGFVLCGIARRAEGRTVLTDALNTLKRIKNPASLEIAESEAQLTSCGK
jgi:eukaryotic-like serine/threonine-protein kinase